MVNLKISSFTLTLAGVLTVLAICDATDAQMNFPQSEEFVAAAAAPSSDVEIINRQSFMAPSNIGAFGFGAPSAPNPAIPTSVFRLAQQINLEAISKAADSHANHVMSPVSVFSALALVLLGAYGSTFNELAQVMGLNIDPLRPSIVHQQIGNLLQSLAQQPGLNNQFQSPWQNIRFEQSYRSDLEEAAVEKPSITDFATAMFLQNDYPIRSEYQQAARDSYLSDVLNTDFKRNPDNAKELINRWVSDHTHGKIRDVLPASPPTDTRVILASALYYYGEWVLPFFPEGTTMRPFFPDGQSGTSHNVQLMANFGKFYYHKSDAYDCKVIALPYKDNTTTMYVFLPNNSSASRLKEFHNNLTPEIVQSLISNLRLRETILLLPKMKLTANVDLRSTMINLGAPSVFDENRANLALISPGEQNPSGALNQMMGDSPFHSSVPGIISGHSEKMFSPPVHLEEMEEKFIFSRIGETDDKNKSDEELDTKTNCSEIFNSSSSIQNCTVMLNKPETEVDSLDAASTDKKSKVVYKKFGNQIGRRITRDVKPNRDWLKDVVIQKKGLKSHDITFEKKKIKRTVESRRVRQKRQAGSLDDLRQLLSQQQVPNPGLYVGNVLHKVDLTVTEKGTEGAAATLVTIFKDGNKEVFKADTPFMFLIRHDPTGLDLFYGLVNKPTYMDR